jgi:hypothetical protein
VSTASRVVAEAAVFGQWLPARIAHAELVELLLQRAHALAAVAVKQELGGLCGGLCAGWESISTMLWRMHLESRFRA